MQPIKVFCSFAPQDKIAVDRLEDHLSVLKHNRQIEIWHAGKITAGTERDRERSIQLQLADIVLLIVSPNYMASHQCYEVEAPRAVQMANAGIVLVGWIPFRHVMHEEAVFSGCPNLLKDGKFLRDWPDKDKPLHQICQEIDALVSQAFSDRQRREENRTFYGYRLDITHPLPLMPPLKVKKSTKEPVQSKQSVIQSSAKQQSQLHSKQTSPPASQKRNAGNKSGVRRRRKPAGTVARNVTASRSLNFNLRRNKIERKFAKNRGTLFIILFIVDVVALPLTIRSWSDSWLLVGLAFALSTIFFSLGTLTIDSILPIVASLVFAIAWGGLILHFFPWPPPTSSLFFVIIVIISVASVHYMVFR
jgi:hypothetical protein